MPDNESGSGILDEMQERERTIAYLSGRYEAFALLTTSVRMNKPQIALIESLALETKDKLEALGVEFKERP
jgi:hypothetical protein